MHLPFIQIANEAVDVVATEVATILGADELAILGGLVRVYRWALQRCSDNLPPSASAVVTGAHAAKLIAKAAGYTGDPEAYVSACETASIPAMERVWDGVRIRGLDRYDAAWGKSHPDLWKLWKQSRSGTGPEPAPIRSESAPKSGGTGPEPAPQMQTQIQIQEKKVVVGARTLESVPEPEAFEPDATGEYQPTAWGFWGWHNKERQGAGLFHEATPPSDLPDWFGVAAAELGIPGVSQAYRVYLADPEFATDRGKPFAVFRSPNVYQARASAKKPRKAWR